MLRLVLGFRLFQRLLPPSLPLLLVPLLPLLLPLPQRFFVLSLLLLRCTNTAAWVASAQRWPSNASGLWRPEAVAVRNGAISALWDWNPQAKAVRISYAWDPTLCDALLGRFPEVAYGVAFVTCSGLRAAMERAFESWEVRRLCIHHPT